VVTFPRKNVFMVMFFQNNTLLYAGALLKIFGTLPEVLCKALKGVSRENKQGKKVVSIELVFLEGCVGRVVLEFLMLCHLFIDCATERQLTERRITERRKIERQITKDRRTERRIIEGRKN
jgi:hypothetical protein